MQTKSKRRVVDVDRGLFLVRYASAEDASCPPRVRLSPDVGFADDIRFVLHPDEDEPILTQVGTGLVMLIEGRAKLVIDVTPSGESNSVGAKVNVEPLIQRDASARPTDRPPGRASLSLADFSVLGHVASRGDVTVKANQWLAGPAAPARIEGLRIAWTTRPSGLNLRYSVKSTQSKPADSPAVELGAFAGSRGKALPITGLHLELSGPAARRFKLSAEMIFLGAAMLQVTGEAISGSGPTGREPLVGLRLAVEEIPAALAPEPPRLSPVARPVERVRVFRSAYSDQQAG